jgi:hypothetical protein
VKIFDFDDFSLSGLERNPKNFKWSLLKRFDGLHGGTRFPSTHLPSSFSYYRQPLPFPPPQQISWPTRLKSRSMPGARYSMVNHWGQ